jgi:hypothetical protein
MRKAFLLKGISVNQTFANKVFLKIHLFLIFFAENLFHLHRIV